MTSWGGYRSGTSWREYRSFRVRKLTSSQIAEVQRRYAAGETGSALAKRFGVTPKTIYNYVKWTR